jgi:hypothetical protein
MEYVFIDQKFEIGRKLGMHKTGGLIKMKPKIIISNQNTHITNPK